MLIPNDYRRDGADVRQLDKMIADGKAQVYVFYYQDPAHHCIPILVNLLSIPDGYAFTIPGEQKFIAPHDAWGCWISDSFQEAVECYNKMIDAYIKSYEQKIAWAKQDYLETEASH